MKDFSFINSRKVKIKTKYYSNIIFFWLKMNKNQFLYSTIHDKIFIIVKVTK